MSTTFSGNASFLSHIDDWRAKLLDLTKRNPLISLKMKGRGTTIVLSHPGPEELWMWLSERTGGVTFRFRGDDSAENEHSMELAPHSLSPFNQENLRADQMVSERTRGEKASISQNIICRPGEILTSHSDQELRNRLRTQMRRAKESLSEQGIHTLYLVMGTLRWRETSDSEDWLTAPLLLVPVNLNRESPGSPWTLIPIDDEIQSNQPLTELLRQEYGVELPEPPDLSEDTDHEHGMKYQTAVDRWRDWLDTVRTEFTRHISCEGWTVEEKTVVGLFRFQKLPIWYDLGTHREQIAEHPICRALCGDSSRMADFSPNIRGLEEEKIDQTVQPENLYTILDCDSSQLRAILAAERGASIVLDGPPGTGKSQTIANMIAQMIADGKKILFVSEKSAALEVVWSRLHQQRLSDFCLNCHQTDGSSQRIYDELQRCLGLPKEDWNLSQNSEMMRQLYRLREHLNQYIQVVHTAYGAMQKTPWWVHGRVSTLCRICPEVRTRFTISRPTELTREAFRQRMELLRQLRRLDTVMKERKSHPWRQCVVEEGDRSAAVRDIRNAFELFRTGYPEIAKILRTLFQDELLPEMATRSDCNWVVEFFRSLRHGPMFPVQWFTFHPTKVIHLLQEIRQLQQKKSRLITSLKERFTEEFLNDSQRKEKILSFQETLDIPMVYPASEKKSDPDTLRQRIHFLGEIDVTIQEVVSICANVRESLNLLLKMMAFPTTLVNQFNLIPMIVRIAKIVVQIPPMPESWLRKKESEQAEFRKQLELLETRGVMLDHAWKMPQVRRFFSEEGFSPNTFSGKIGTSMEVVFGERFREQGAGNGNEGHTSWTDIPIMRIQRLRTTFTQQQESMSQLEQLRKTLSSRLNFIQDLWSESSVARLQELVQMIRETEQMCRMLESTRTLISSNRQIPIHWKSLTAGQVDKIKNVLERLNRLLQPSEQIQTRLSERMTEDAFRETGRRLATEAMRYRSFWQRMPWSSWKRFRTTVIQQLYQSEGLVFDDKMLRNDLGDLKKYHELCDPTKIAVSEYLSQDTDHSATILEFMNCLTRMREFLNTYEQLFRKVAKGMCIPWNLELSLESLCEDHSEILEFSRIWKSVSDSVTSFFPEFTDARNIGILEIHGALSEFLKLYTEYETLFYQLYGSNKPMFYGNKAYYQDIYRGLELTQRVAKAFRGEFPAVLAKLISRGEIQSELLASSAKALHSQYDQCVQKIRSTEILSDLVPDQTDEEMIARSPEDLSQILSEAQKTVTGYHTKMCDFAKIFQSEYDPLITDFTHLILQLDEQELTEQSCLEKEYQYQSLLKSPSEIALEPTDPKRLSFPVRSSTGGSPATSEMNEDFWKEQFCLAEHLSEIFGKYPQYFRTPESLLRKYYTQERYRETLNSRLDQLDRYVVATLSAPVPGVLVPVDSIEDYAAAWRVVERMFSSDFSENRPLKELIEQMERLIPLLPQLEEWLDYRDLVRQMHAKYPDLKILHHEILNGTLPNDRVESVFELTFWQQWLETVYAQHPILRNFRVNEHENMIQEFQHLDRDITAHSFQRIRQKLLNDPERPSQDTLWVASGSELGILKRELEKKRRRLSIRQLFQKIPNVLLRLKPCLMMSPLAVSTYLGSEACIFDVVIFDEASQVCPWDAVGAIYRGKQLIVAGDQKQLPPSRYFERQMGDAYDEVEPDDEEAVSMDNFESILDMCCSLMNRFRLKWHYRSRREPLIAFSNHFFYNDELVTFPGVCDDSHIDPAIRFHYVPSGVWHKRTNGPEAEETARLVQEHFQNHPEESLGVVTFSVDQQNAVEDAIECMRERHPELDLYFRESRESPFFVKNLETVQGDERDRMILCVGYARDPAGKLAMRFGPLNLAGGERRLNVAITRAKKGLTLVSSLKYSDISETKHSGPQLLRAYLEYAEKGTSVLKNPEPQVASTPEMEDRSSIETEVETALQARGLEVSRQIGCGGFRVDLALSVPEIPNQFVLGIECDGVTSRNCATARDRDRLRQEILEGLGWTVCRVWSTNWWQNPEKQIQQILNACECAKQKFLTAKRSVPILRTHDSVRMREVALREKPIIQRVPRQMVSQFHFNSIDDIPNETIRSKILEIYQINGRIPLEELLRLVRECLGFARLGDRIRKRLMAVIRELERQGLIVTGIEE